MASDLLIEPWESADYASRCMDDVAATLDRCCEQADKSASWESAGHLRRWLTQSLRSIARGLQTNAARERQAAGLRYSRTLTLGALGERQRIAQWLRERVMSGRIWTPELLAGLADRIEQGVEPAQWTTAEREAYQPLLIISGGQTGADQGGLRAAKRLGIQTGGWAAHGYQTERGQDLSLLVDYNLDEHAGGYGPRTRANVDWADATLIFGKASPGSTLTMEVCEALDRRFYRLRELPLRTGWPELREAWDWLREVRPPILNVAGNRESVWPGIGALVEAYVVRLLHAEAPFV